MKNEKSKKAMTSAITYSVVSGVFFFPFLYLIAVIMYTYDGSLLGIMLSLLIIALLLIPPIFSWIGYSMKNPKMILTPVFFFAIVGAMFITMAFMSFFSYTFFSYINRDLIAIFAYFLVEAAIILMVVLVFIYLGFSAYREQKCINEGLPDDFKFSKSKKIIKCIFVIGIIQLIIGLSYTIFVSDTHFERRAFQKYIAEEILTNDENVKFNSGSSTDAYINAISKKIFFVINDMYVIRTYDLVQTYPRNTEELRANSDKVYEVDDNIVIYTRIVNDARQREVIIRINDNYYIPLFASPYESYFNRFMFE